MLSRTILDRERVPNGKWWHLKCEEKIDGLNSSENFWSRLESPLLTALPDDLLNFQQPFHLQCLQYVRREMFQHKTKALSRNRNNYRSGDACHKFYCSTTNKHTIYIKLLIHSYWLVICEVKSLLKQNLIIFEELNKWRLRI